MNNLEKNQYYVWFDTFLEEHFVLELDEFNKNPGLQRQLKKKKINYVPIEAENRKEAVVLYKKDYPVNPHVFLDTSTEHTSSVPPKHKLH